MEGTEVKPISLSQFIDLNNTEPQFIDCEGNIIESTCPPIKGTGFALEKSIATAMQCAAQSMKVRTQQDRFNVSGSAGNDNDKPDLTIGVRKVAGKQFSGTINIEIKDQSAQGTQIGLKNNFDPNIEVTETSWVQSGRKKVKVSQDVWLGIIRAIHTKKFDLITKVQQYLRTSMEPAELHKKSIIPGKLPFGKVSKVAWKELGGNKGTIFTQQGDKLDFNFNEYINDPENIKFYEEILQQKNVHFIYIQGRGMFSTGADGAPQVPGIRRLRDAITGSANVEIRLKASGGSYSGGGEEAKQSMVRYLYCNQDPREAKNKSIYMQDWAGSTPASQSRLYMFDNEDKMPPNILHEKGNEVGKLVSISHCIPSDKPYKWKVRMVMQHRTTSPTLQFTTRIDSGKFTDSIYKFDSQAEIENFLNAIP
jgi:hypothetical protein